MRGGPPRGRRAGGGRGRFGAGGARGTAGGGWARGVGGGGGGGGGGVNPPPGPAGNPVFVQALSAASGGRIIPVPGGVLIRDRAGDILGAVGISGDTSENDELCAVHGVGCTGLVPDTRDPT